MSLCLNSRHVALDITFYIYTFLSYKETTILQKSSKKLNFHQPKMNKYSQHEHPHGKIELYNRKTKLIIYEKNYKEGKKEGIQKSWHENGQIWNEGNYKEGKKEGIQKNWYDNGQLCYEENYKEGELDGIQKEWYKNGQLEYERNYKEGELDGIQKEWYKNGQLEYEIIIKKEKKKGYKKNGMKMDN